MARTDERLPDVTIRNAQLVFRNFAGAEDRFNAKGNRNFSVILPNEVAAAMATDGWNVKQFKENPDGDAGESYIQVAVQFDKGRPPRITLISSAGRNNIGGDLVEMLDAVDIEKCDIVISPYHWTSPSGSGIKAYLKTMFMTIAEDELEREYNELSGE